MGFAGRVSALLLFLVAGAVASDQIFTASGVPFGRSSREPRYRVEFHPVDSPYQPENGQESVPMASHEGKHYTCFLPVEETKTMKSILPQNATNVIIGSDRRIKPKEPDELLEPLKDQCFYRHEGWWSYEFCYHGKIRQVHVEGDKPRSRGGDSPWSRMRLSAVRTLQTWRLEQCSAAAGRRFEEQCGRRSFPGLEEQRRRVELPRRGGAAPAGGPSGGEEQSRRVQARRSRAGTGGAGEYDDDATIAYHENSTSEFADDDHHVKDTSRRYHVHLYTNGTVCDLTDIPRETEVRFVCSEPTVLISSIKEISSCKYVVTIQSPMLCKNPLFHQEKRNLSIHCNELPTETESTVIVDDDSLPKEAQISIIPDQDELHGFTAYAT